MEANLGWERGVNLKGPLLTLGQGMGGKQPISEKGSIRREDSSVMGKGKSISEVSVSQLRGSATKFGSKKLWYSLSKDSFVVHTSFLILAHNCFLISPFIILYS